MAGGCIIQRIDESLTYDYLHSSEDNLWSMLYLTGYLTKVSDDYYDGELQNGELALMIPNAEIKEIFETTVIKWFDDSAKNGIAMSFLMLFGVVIARSSQVR